MPRKMTKLLSRLRRSAFTGLSALARLDPSGRTEHGVGSMMITRASRSPAQLQSLAWLAEEREDLPLALRAWMALTSGKLRGKKIPATKVYSKLAALETRMRRRVSHYAPERGLDQGDAPEVVLSPARFAGQARPGGRALRMEHEALREFWQAVDAMTESQQAQLRKAYAGLSAHRNRAKRQHIALSALQPVLARWPDYQTAYPLYYKAVLQSIRDMLDDPEGEGVDSWRMLDSWWQFYETRQTHLAEATRHQIWSLSLRFASRLQEQGHLDEAERIILPAFSFWDDNAVALPVLAQVAESRGNWREAAGHWQLYASIMNPVSTKSGTIRAENAEERQRRTNYARGALRQVRASIALEARAEGRRREFRELVTRIVESLPDQRLLKYDPHLLEAARHYVQDALREDGAFDPVRPAEEGGLRRIVVCLDILKVSEVHTHSRVIFTMCRNLLAHDPDLQIDVVITNERFAVTTPVVSDSFNPARQSDLGDRAAKALGEFYGTRFHLHQHQGSGLEGVVDSCKKILMLNPDVILYGGGHRGLFSNESRLVRHALFDLAPAAFFYIQANNQVDPKFDMVIARGPHAIEGDPGEALIRVQPYPTIVDEALSQAQTAVDPSKADAKVLVSAITGVRMDVRLSEMTKEETKGFFSILDRVPGAVWHFIGCRDIAAVRRANPEIARRVDAGQIKLHTVMPFDAFTALVGNASMFLHLPGFTGGSGGAAVARRGAVPILTFNHSDVSGRQPPETVFEADNIAGFADKAVEVLTDRDRWVAVAERQIAHTEWIRETSVQGFSDCLTEAARQGQARLAGRATAVVPRDERPALRVVQGGA